MCHFHWNKDTETYVGSTDILCLYIVHKYLSRVFVRHSGKDYREHIYSWCLWCYEDEKLL